MMNRRSFLASQFAAATLGTAALEGAAVGFAAEETPPPAFYEIVSLRLQFGEQIGRVLGWFEKRAFPLFEKHKLGPVGIFTVNVGAAIPSVLGIFKYSSLAEMESTWAKLSADPDWAAAHAELDAGDAAYYREDISVLRATSFSPPLKAAAAGDPAHKIYELRIYESPTVRQLGYLHDRFGGGEIEIFHKSGIHPVLYADTVIGPNMPNMAYLIPFETQEAREKGWAAFGNNPDWAKLRDDSVRRGGEIVRNITNMILTPAGFSMLR
jgi:NIPSNAP